MKHILESLPYAYTALEPYIDAKTMEIHHTKHHQTYVDKLNETIDGYTELETISIETMLQNIKMVPETIRQAVINFGGGTYNHTIFWKSMSPTGIHIPQGPLLEEIEKTYGSYDAWWEQFKTAALTHFGSGWAWCVMTPDRHIQITKTANQDTPYVDGLTPLLGIDVWEHAYYLAYQNKRGAYIDAWKSVIDWTYAMQRYEQHA